MEMNNRRPLNKIWTQTEKETLLRILKTDGHTNLDRIAEALPNKSVSAIKTELNKYKVLAKSLKPHTSDPLDFWLHSHFSPEDENLIPKALLFIRLFEDLPPPQELNGVNIRSIYDFLHRSTLGHSPGEISSETWKFIEKEISEMKESVTNVSEREVLTHLSTFTNKKKPAKDYSRKNRDKNVSTGHSY